ncbi:MAG: CRISPR-associated endonuclease Cas2 [Thermotogae bacterium]|nr:CRISPR-associated endonuclease Cas2 [Thermotogota bacterium]
MFVILVYDVGVERVAKVHKICKRYLTWVQNSVFEGELTRAQLRSLKAELRSAIDDEHDSVLFYKFRTKAYYRRESMGVKRPSSEDFIF